MEKSEEFTKVYEKAVKLLSLRMHTRSELERKLFRYKYDKPVINEVLDRLIELNILNDERFAEIFLDNLIRFKTFGYYGLKAKLLSKGITSAIGEKLLKENLSIQTELKIAEKLASRKSSDPEKLAASLQRKGFRSEVIALVLKNSEYMV